MSGMEPGEGVLNLQPDLGVPCCLSERVATWPVERAESVKASTSPQQAEPGKTAPSPLMRRSRIRP
jgi:hypothetical protein